MLFNSIEFAIFCPIFFYLYWALKNRLELQNYLVVAASYLFYGWWDWRFLSLIIFTSATTFTTGLLIAKSKQRAAKLWMWINIIINVAILGFFKYFNFFTDNLKSLASLVGLNIDWFTLEVLLPVGISFYTFQAISYTVDVYKKDISPTRNIGAFFAYIAFFPQLIAGPIERSTSLLPQFLTKRVFNYREAVMGMRQILWGLAKKILIADFCAHYSDLIFDRPEYYAGTSIILGIFLFMFQIYGDYSGYSDIAIGLGKIFGIRLSQNFNYPLFSRSMSEFWQRWNITLMDWLRRYIYFPLGGSRKGVTRTCINIFIVFLISGIWHGADWIFILWGITNAILIFPHIIFRVKTSIVVATYRDLPLILLTFVTTAFITISFRCSSIAEAINYLSYASLDSGQWSTPTGKTPFIFIIPMLIIEWINRKEEFGMARLPHNRTLRWSIYWVILFLLIYGSAFESLPYLYFQF